MAAWMQTGSKSIKASYRGVGVMCLYEGSVEMFTLMEAIMSAYSAALCSDRGAACQQGFKGRAQSLGHLAHRLFLQSPGTQSEGMVRTNR